MKLESCLSAEDRKKLKIVRTDDYTDVYGEIVTADEAAGECCIMVAGEIMKLNFGPGGIRIVRRK
jgi:hypothetical protein